MASGAYPKSSWAAIVKQDPADSVSKATSAIPNLTSATSDGGRPTQPVSQPEPAASRPRIAFISGHIDITPTQFADNYHAAIDAAILRGDTFVLSNAGGVDTLALTYLRARHVVPSRITIYLHTPRPSNRKLNATQVRINKMRLGPEVEEEYKRTGYNVRVISGYHTERDAAMTDESDYDVLWV